MLLKYINSNRISVTIFFVLIVIAIWTISLFHNDNQLIETNSVLLGKVIIAFNEKLHVLASLIAMLLVFINGFLLIQLNTRHIFIPHRTELPSFFYGVLIIGMTQLHHLTPALVASTLLIIVFYRIFDSYKFEKISLNFIDAGLLISIASLFYFQSIFFFIFLLAALSLLRPFIWREWVFAFIGLILPYIFIISIYYLADIPVSKFFADISDSFKKISSTYRFSEIVNWSFILFFILISSYYMANAIDAMKIHARKFFLVFLSFFATSVTIFLFIPGSGIYLVYFASIPLSYLFGYYFIRCKRNWINEILVTLFLLLLLWQRIN